MSLLAILLFTATMALSLWATMRVRQVYRKFSLLPANRAYSDGARRHRCCPGATGGSLDLCRRVHHLSHLLPLALAASSGEPQGVTINHWKTRHVRLLDKLGMDANEYPGLMLQRVIERNRSELDGLVKIPT
jgi:hypothetical protein